MNLTTVVTIPGKPTALVSMMACFNEACNWLSQIAFEERIFHWLPLQRRAYRELRERFGLTGIQATVAVRKVACAYKGTARRNTLVSFRPLGGIPLHRHSYRKDGTVLIYGLRVPFRTRPGVVLSSQHQATLVYRGGRCFIQQVIEVEEPRRQRAEDYLGCDLGIVNILADSDGATYSGEDVERRRRIFAHRRRNIQRRGTRSAKRKLRRIRRTQGRYQRDVNHCISKAVVAKAHRHSLGIALEDLKGVRERITARRKQRARRHNWAFDQLGRFIVYKGALQGVPVVFVDPRHTSQVCPVCGVIDRANRPARDLFHCVSCGFSAPADHVAARNIRARAASDQPMAPARAG